MKANLEDIMDAANHHKPSSFCVRSFWTENGRIASDTRLIETCDEFVSFLFDKVELFGWRIDNYSYNPRAHVTGITDDLRCFIYGDRLTATITKEI